MWFEATGSIRWHFYDPSIAVYFSHKKETQIVKDKEKKEDNTMKGYVVAEGYMGYVNGVYMLFSNETDYIEHLNWFLQWHKNVQ